MFYIRDTQAGSYETIRRMVQNEKKRRVIEIRAEENNEKGGKPSEK